jgi:hypothetical protein
VHVTAIAPSVAAGFRMGDEILKELDKLAR